jgi:hypothetical protein
MPKWLTFAGAHRVPVPDTCHSWCASDAVLPGEALLPQQMQHMA